MAKQVLSDLDFNNVAKIVNLANPTSAQDAATMAYVDAFASGTSWKDAARVASQANINLASPGATIDGITMATGDRVLLRNQTAQAENGIYIWNGATTAMTRSTDADTVDELEAATIRVEEGTDAGVKFVQTQINFTLGTSNVVFQTDGSASPSASETTAGIAEIATQAETDAGTDDVRIVTPLKLKNSSLSIKRFSTNVGNGSATQYDLTHNLGSRDVTVELYRNSGNYDTVIADVSRPDINTVRLNFAAAPTANQFRAVIKL